MICNITETDIKTLHNIEIGQVSSTTNAEKDPIQWKTLAEMELGQTESPTLSPGINASAKNYVAGGSWDLTTPANTYLTLSMSIEKLVCDDARAYRCSLLYESSTKGTVIESPTKGTLVSTDMNATFSAFVKPQVTSLNVKKNGFKVQGGSPSDMTTAEVGDELELTCKANIGSLQGTIIRWHRTSETSQNDDFIGYQPPQGTFDEGTAVSDNQCGYTRVASIKYNVTAADANRDNNLAFECYVTVSGDPYGNTYTSKNNPRFYTDVTKPDGGTTSSNTLAAGNKITSEQNAGFVNSMLFSFDLNSCLIFNCSLVSMPSRRSKRQFIQMANESFLEL
ncbi:uncharacterized protein LOC132733257 [Ruditapes philippinarum]|uniref:uncharacterized protein LOC132733257 n=1 Tax=Ruditapes philippinarum TaxID=129788 RepID=UPI00295C09E3|nr:uncharacterized protein LOC132733257 [Ruditapes philippinarum]